MANEQPGAGSGEPEGDSFERRLREALEHTAREMRDKHASLDCTFEVITHAAVDLIPGVEHAGITLATRAAVAVIAAQREEQFRSALASRDIIGQAKGILMDRFSVDADRAFGLLRQLSQDRNAPLVEIARELAETEHPPQGGTGPSALPVSPFPRCRLGLCGAGRLDGPDDMWCHAEQEARPRCSTTPPTSRPIEWCVRGGAGARSGGTRKGRETAPGRWRCLPRSG
ncbi:RNA binding sensor regulator [Rhodococcus ruber BKS 20-38]|uniref:RNA binding sensor regulator n=1 Tax=Rhodococcus ruber BKS 20-38 TaxID=1278076 RepID=M3A409_9NOCA|nr:RNA binding sensor regulator [Rhodococcus ruber BKS 20-38]